MSGWIQAALQQNTVVVQVPEWFTYYDQVEENTNKEKFRKISQFFMNNLANNVVFGVLEVVILELDKAYDDIRDFKSPIWYLQEDAYIPQNWAGKKFK